MEVMESEISNNTNKNTLIFISNVNFILLKDIGMKWLINLFLLNLEKIRNKIPKDRKQLNKAGKIMIFEYSTNVSFKALPIIILVGEPM
jgi:hypothetical protein